jgi:hypothetical protein
MLGWDTFGVIGRFNAAEARRRLERPPLDCPNDGEGLEQVGDRRVCPADGWSWPERKIVNPARRA